MGICYIVGAGDFSESIRPAAGDLVIAADGGYRHLAALGLRPDLLLGDLDSLDTPPADIEILRYPARKDDTDMALAIREGEARGYRVFRLYGALGGRRVDHTLANVQTLLACARRGLSARIVGGGQCITVLTQGSLSFPRDMQGYLTVLAIGGPARGVSLSGVAYPLQDATLAPDTPLGVSNEFLAGTPACVTISEGSLLLVFPDVPSLDAPA